MFPEKKRNLCSRQCEIFNLHCLEVLNRTLLPERQKRSNLLIPPLAPLAWSLARSLSFSTQDAFGISALMRKDVVGSVTQPIPDNLRLVANEASADMVFRCLMVSILCWLQFQSGVVLWRRFSFSTLVSFSFSYLKVLCFKSALTGAGGFLAEFESSSRYQTRHKWAGLLVG